VVRVPDFDPAMSFTDPGGRPKILGRASCAWQEFHVRIKPVLQILQQLWMIALTIQI